MLEKHFLSLTVLTLCVAIPLWGATPPQVINKLCPSNQFLSQIQPGPNNIQCTQPTYSGISDTPNFSQSIEIIDNVVTLFNDATSPGNSKYYGTNSSGSKGFFSLPVASSSVGTIDSVSSSSNGGVISGNALIFQSASSSFPGLVNNTTQSFSGNKTFTGTIGASNLSGTNTGDVTLGTANGLSMGGQVLSLGLSSTATNGALSSTDWNTFNNKQTSGNYLTAITGDVVATGPGSASSTIQANVVTDAKIRQSGALSVIGRSANSTGNVADISAGTDNFILRRSGTALGFGLLVNANVDAAAAIAGTKISPDFGSQNITTLGSGTVAGLTLNGGSAANLSLWSASNVLRMRDGSAGFILQNTSNVSMLTFDDAGSFSMGLNGQPQSIVGSKIQLGATGSAAIGVLASNAAINDGSMVLTGATSTANGAQLVVYGNAHATKANQTEFNAAGSTHTTVSSVGNWLMSGSVTASNLSGTNTGDVTLGTANGLSLVGQALSLALSSTSTTGSLSSTDWNTFNSKQTAGNYLTALTGNVVATGPGSAAATIQSGAIVNSMVSASAAIDGTKISPNFGSQAVSTGGTLAAGQSTLTGVTLNGGTVANLSLWSASNVLRARGGTSGFVLQNTSNTSLLSTDDNGAFTIGIATQPQTILGTKVQLGASGAAAVGVLASNAASNDGSMVLTGATSSANGAQMVVYGNSHATKANKTEFNAGGSTHTTVDASGNWVHSGTVTMNAAGNPIKGSSTNDAAATGYVGEYVESVISSLTNWPAATATWGNFTSISLTAGDWDATCLYDQVANGATVTSAVGSNYAAISINSGSTTTDQVIGSNQLSLITPSNTADRSGVISNYRLSLSGTTTIYCKGIETYAVATPQYRARLSARRMR